MENYSKSRIIKHIPEKDDISDTYVLGQARDSGNLDEMDKAYMGCVYGNPENSTLWEKYYKFVESNPAYLEHFRQAAALVYKERKGKVHLAYWALGKHSEYNKEFDDALDFYQKSIKILDTFDLGYLALVEFGCRTNKLDEIDDMFMQKEAELVQRKSVNIVLGTFHAYLWFLKGEIDRALEYVQIMKDLDPSYVTARKVYIAILEKKGETDQTFASKALDEKIELGAIVKDQFFGDLKDYLKKFEK